MMMSVMVFLMPVMLFRHVCFSQSHRSMQTLAYILDIKLVKVLSRILIDLARKR